MYGSHLIDIVKQLEQLSYASSKRGAEQWVIDANSKVIGCAFVTKSNLIEIETDQKRIRAVREARET